MPSGIFDVYMIEKQDRLKHVVVFARLMTWGVLKKGVD